MKRMTTLCLAIMAISAVTLAAQEFTYRYSLDGFEFGNGTPVQDRLVKGAPYAAQFVSEHVQTLPDGNRIVRKTTGRVYRDSEGRVRRETDRPSGDPLITITDPVAKTTVTLDPAKRTARSSAGLLIYDLKRELTAVTEAARSSLVTITGTQAAPPTATARGGGRGGGGGGGARRALAPPDERTEEKLAEKNVEGVTATGIRRVTTIAQGKIGNERPIQIVSEEWTSTELHVLVLTDLNDPRTGRSTYRLFMIARGNQPASLFEIPAGYTIVKEPSPDWIIRDDLRVYKNR